MLTGNDLLGELVVGRLALTLLVVLVGCVDTMTRGKSAIVVV